MNELTNDLMETFINTAEMQLLDLADSMTFFEWIKKNCNLGGRPYSEKDHEFQKEILEDKSRVLKIKKCAQIGVSVISILRGFAMLGLYRNFTILYILPTASFSRAFNATRITPLLDECKVLSEMRDKSVDSTEIKKFGPNNFLHSKGSVSKSAAISIDADCLIIDEKDFCTDQSILTTFQSRLLHSPYKFDTELSTPTLPKFGIDAAFRRSRRKVHMAKCVHCSTWFKPAFRQIILPGVEDPSEVTEDELLEHGVNNAFLKCPHCGSDQLILLEQLPRPRSRSPSSEIFIRN